MTKEKILIVEDDDDLRRGLCLRLGSLGYEVVTAQDGVGAVSVARAEQPDLVLLDIGLPGGDGISVLQRYENLAALNATPVVVLTGRDPHVTEPVVRQHHVAAFLRKPADNEQLAEAIDVALHGTRRPAAASTQENKAPESKAPESKAPQKESEDKLRAEPADPVVHVSTWFG